MLAIGTNIALLAYQENRIHKWARMITQCVKMMLAIAKQQALTVVAWVKEIDA